MINDSVKQNGCENSVPERESGSHSRFVFEKNGAAASGSSSAFAATP